MTHSRSPLTRLNCTGIAWYCPKAAAISKPWGEHLSCVKFKGHTSLLPPPPSLAIPTLRKEHEPMAHWDYCFLSLSLNSTFLLLPLEMHWKAAHSMAKHTAMPSMPLVPLNMQAPQIMAFTAHLLLTSLLIFRVGTLLPAVLCSPSKQWKWHWQQKGYRSYLDTYRAPGRISLRLLQKTSEWILQ